MRNRWNTLEHWADLEPTFNFFEELRRRMDRVLDEELSTKSQQRRPMPFHAVLYDTGEAFELKADLPGIQTESIDLSLEDGVLTIKAERALPHREGYTTHRQERRAVKLGRAFTLPAKVDPELTKAQFDNGVLTVTVGKAPESKPKQIKVISAG
ncbi:MAG: Hsp20/alpha crystallin family protein [Bradymonadia bacterium]